MTRLIFFLPVICIFVFSNILLSSDYDDLFLLYKNKKIERLKARVSELEKRNLRDPEIVFFRTIFKDNGDEALKIYQELYGGSAGPLKNLVAGKMSEYYFAQGYYVKAREFSRAAEQKFKVKAKETSRPVDNKKVESTDPKIRPRYIIQVGAFGVEKNANDLAEILQRKKINAKVVTRDINDKILYCVWVQGDEDYSSTKKIAEEVKTKFRLTYRILKP